jgi:hypothetical protein
MIHTVTEKVVSVFVRFFITFTSLQDAPQRIGQYNVAFVVEGMARAKRRFSENNRNRAGHADVVVKQQ